MENLIYRPEAARALIDDAAWESLHGPLEAARTEVLADVELFETGGAVPSEKEPFDAGFVRYPQHLLEGNPGLLDRIEEAAGMFRDELDRVVFLGIGGSYMGARALREALLHPYHNELTRSDRGGVPRVYFDGHNMDTACSAGLRDLLPVQGAPPDQPASRWGIVVISKSGGTLETAVSFRVFRGAIEEYYGRDSDESRRYVIPITGEEGKLRSLSERRGYPATFPIPDGIGGRFSIFTAVGILPAAVMGIDVRQLLAGAAAMNEMFEQNPMGENPVLDYVATSHLLEQAGRDTRILSTWGTRLEAAGLWYDQLLSESLGKAERGALPLTVVNTRDLHSRGQQHQEGRQDKIITNLFARENSDANPLLLPEMIEDDDRLNRHAGKSLPQLLSAALAGTNRAYEEDQRPTADLELPRLDAFALGQFFQMMMLATYLEGRLIGINPFGQPGVEAYKRNMTEILEQS